MIEMKMTDDTAKDVLWAVQEHLFHRASVHAYVDSRYANMDEAFRNRKIGDMQERFDRLNLFRDSLLTAIATQPQQGESK